MQSHHKLGFVEYPGESPYNVGQPTGFIPDALPFFEGPDPQGQVFTRPAMTHWQQNQVFAGPATTFGQQQQQFGLTSPPLAFEPQQHGFRGQQGQTYTGPTTTFGHHQQFAFTGSPMAAGDPMYMGAPTTIGWQQQHGFMGQQGQISTGPPTTLGWQQQQGFRGLPTAAGNPIHMGFEQPDMFPTGFANSGSVAQANPMPQAMPTAQPMAQGMVQTVPVPQAAPMAQTNPVPEAASMPWEALLEMELDSYLAQEEATILEAPTAQAAPVTQAASTAQEVSLPQTTQVVQPMAQTLPMLPATPLAQTVPLPQVEPPAAAVSLRASTELEDLTQAQVQTALPDVSPAEPGRDTRFAKSGHKRQPKPKKKYPERQGKKLRRYACTRCRLVQKGCRGEPGMPCERCVAAGEECIRDGIDKREKEHRQNRNRQSEEEAEVMPETSGEELGATPESSDPPSDPEVAAIQGRPHDWNPETSSSDSDPGYPENALLAMSRHMNR